VLNRNGIDAAVLHQQPGFRCDWFEHDTRIRYLSQVRMTADDFLVIPEIYGPNIPALSRLPGIGAAVRKVIFNQNCRYTFLGQTLDGIRDPGFAMAYTNRQEYIGVMVVSEDSRSYLEFAFPDVDVWRIHNAINLDIFSAGEEKKRQICFMPRKHQEDALQVLAILKLHGALRDFDIVPIADKTETEVAAIMRESMLFLSFGYPEGCPLPPAEAMACGCLVIGYDGFGGREYFDTAFSYPVQVGDITGFVSTLESLLTSLCQDPGKLLAQGRQASAYVRETYSPEREQDDIVGFWSRFHAVHASGTAGGNVI
jgi:glycosyltransferase involved in cell wall biosynthesis